MKESELYPRVTKFLRSHFGCTWSRVRAGTNQGIVDVLGVRHVAGDLASNEQVIAIEVKRGSEPFLKAVGQALAYSVIAHRVYLAEPKTPPERFHEDQVLIASRLGVGLVEIRPRGCHEILSSRVHDPIPYLCLQALWKLNVAKCIVCGALFECKHVSRVLKRARDDKKGYVYWLPGHENSRGVAREYWYDRRYLCPDCVRGPFGEHTAK